jgi:hypothetical protein
VYRLHSQIYKGNRDSTVIVENMLLWEW